jgi:hypothetical protein
MGRTGRRAAVNAVTAAAQPAYSGMRSLSRVLDETRVIRAMRAASLAEASEPEPEHLYSVGKDGVVVAHPVTRKTDKTIWYQRAGRMRWKFAWFDMTLPDGTSGSEYRFTGDQEWSQPSLTLCSGNGSNMTAFCARASQPAP